MRNMPSLIVDRIGPLVEPLHDAFEAARFRIDTDYRGLCRPNQRWLRTHNLRGLTYQHLQDNELPDDWRLTGNHRRNGAINLTFGTGEMTLRFVHSFPLAEPPSAGPNRARRAWYTQQAMEELADEEALPTQRLLLVWEEESLAESIFSLSVIRPLTPGSLRRQVRRDFEIPLPRTLTAFEQTQFDTSDEDEDLFYEVDEDDLDTGTEDDG